MAKVVFLWNEHPTEHVAAHHAREVARILREKGHEIIMEKVPVDETNYGIVRSARSDEEVEALLERLHENDDRRIAALQAKHDAPVYAFHTTPADSMGEAQERQPEHFRINKRPTSYVNMVLELMFFHLGPDKFLFEVPAEYVPLPERAIAKVRARLERLRKGRMFVRIQAEHSYQTYHAPLVPEKQQKYLSPAISRKIAEVVCGNLTKRRGAFGSILERLFGWAGQLFGRK